MTGDTDKYLGPQDLKELGDDSLPAEGYMGFSLGARSARYCICCCSSLHVTTVKWFYKQSAVFLTKLESVLKQSREGVLPRYGNTAPLKHMFIAVLFPILYHVGFLWQQYRRVFTFSGSCSCSEHLQDSSLLAVHNLSRNWSRTASKNRLILT